jgi:hypothetical protein
MLSHKVSFVVDIIIARGCSNVKIVPPLHRIIPAQSGICQSLPTFVHRVHHQPPAFKGALRGAYLKALSFIHQQGFAESEVQR